MPTVLTPVAGPDARPAVIATWKFALPAVQAAWAVLQEGRFALDAVEAGVVVCEDDESVDSVGFGGLPDAAGVVTLDASIMDHMGRCGAVACVRSIANPIRAARLVMERTAHLLLVGPAADAFAVEQGLPTRSLLSDRAAEAYQKWQASGSSTASGHDSHDTIGLLALDQTGHLAGACSTSGMAFKLPGRVGDSPIIGAGLFVDGAVGAASATGLGEECLRTAGSFAVVENLRRGLPPRDALAEVLQRMARRFSHAPDFDMSLIALRADGEMAGLSLRDKTRFQFAVATPAGARVVDSAALF